MRSERKGTTTRVIPVISIAMLFCAAENPDAPWEKYHVTYGKELRTALQGTIGVLTIGNGVGKPGTQLQTYYRTSVHRRDQAGEPEGQADQFEPQRKLGLLAATIPVSNYGYHPPMGGLPIDDVYSYRYPIVERCSSFLNIVYDPVENWRAWVDLRDVEQDFFTQAVMLDSLAAAEPGSLFLDVFRFTPDRKCRLYKAPSLDADFRVISEQDTAEYLLTVLEVRGGFARVGNYITNPENQIEAPKIVPLGWVRIWDDDGVLLIWVKNEDLC